MFGRSFYLNTFSSQKLTTITMWSTCGRGNGVGYEWEGVVCLGKENYSKVLHLSKRRAKMYLNITTVVLLDFFSIVKFYYNSPFKLFLF